FWNSNNPSNAIVLPQLREASRALNLQLIDIDVRAPSDLDAALEQAARIKPDALLTLVDQVTTRRREDVIKFAQSIRRPGMFALKEFVIAGGLMSYGVSFPDLHYRAARYVHEILKGANPAELPVQQPTKVELVVNLKTAQSIDVALPASILVRADEVIE